MFVSVCSPLQIVDRLADFCKTWYARGASDRHLNAVICDFLYSVTRTQRTHESDKFPLTFTSLYVAQHIINK
jgi:hypothetical protein